MPADRAELLSKLLRFDAPLTSIFSELSGYPWDVEHPVVALRAKHLEGVLRRFQEGKLSASEVEDWANAIECREDVEYSQYREFIHELANPLLTRELTQSTAQELIEHARKLEN